MPLAESLSLDLAMARVGFGRYAAYPIASAAGIFTNVVFGLMRGSILLALFAQRERIGAYDASATLTYVWLTQGLLNVVAMWGWQDLAIRVRTGDIATDLIRPIHPLRAALAADYGRAAYQLLVRAVPPILVGIVIFRTSLPPSPVAWLAFAVSLTLAIAVSLGFRFVYNVAAFWTTDHRGAMILALVVMSVFSGFTIPIQFFPPWLAAIANATPFPSMDPDPRRRLDRGAERIEPGRSPGRPARLGRRFARALVRSLRAGYTAAGNPGWVTFATSRTSTCGWLRHGSARSCSTARPSPWRRSARSSSRSSISSPSS